MSEKHIQKLFSSRKLVPLSSYIGESGRLFYDESTGELRIGDGITAGGSPIYFQSSGNVTMGGDVSGLSNVATVKRINGVSLATLATGILKNTTTYGTPSIATSSDVISTLGYTPVPNTLHVAGHQLNADVTLFKSDVGLGNVDNTSDATKNAASAILTNKTINTSNNTLIIGGNLSFSSYRITNLKNPEQGADGATKIYVDNSVAGFLNKITATVATLGSLPSYNYYNGPANDGVGSTITATSVGSLIIDTYTTILNDIILVKNETAGNAPYNGAYQVTVEGNASIAFVLQRLSNLDQSAEFTGTSVFVTKGNLNLATTWTCVTNSPIIGTTDISFIQSGASISYNAGTGLLLIGTDFAVDNSLVPFKTENLSVFATTTSSQFANVVTDGSGTGSVVFNNSATLFSPTISSLTTYNTEGDRALLSLDASSFRQGSWGVTSSGSLFNLLGNYAMQYYSHNVALDINTGNFLGRDETDACFLWVVTEGNKEEIYWASSNAAGTIPVWNLRRSFDSASGNLSVSGNFIGNTVTQPAFDSSNKISSTEFVYDQMHRTMATLSLSGLTGGTYAFISNGVGGAITYVASGGTISSITSVTDGGSSFNIGDVLSIESGNYDSFIRVTGIGVGGSITSVEILYGGTGYISNNSLIINSGIFISTAFTWILRGTLTSNALFILPGGSFLTHSNQWLISNETTGPYTLTFKLSNGAGSTTGSGVVIPQGSNYSDTILTQTDGVTDIWQAGVSALGYGASGTWNININGNVTGNLTGFSSNVITNANLTGPITSIGNATYVATQTGTGNVFTMNTSPTVTNLSLAAGTTALAPLVFTTGTRLTTPVVGAQEFDGSSLYGTIDTTSGRGIIPIEQFFHLASIGGAISTISNYFGATSNMSLVAGAHYEIEVVLYFLKTTNGTVTITLNNSSAPTNMNLKYEQSPNAGIITPPGSGNQQLNANAYGITTAAYSITTGGNLTGGNNHFMKFNISLQNGTGTSLQIQATSNAGTLTPGIGSYWRCKRVPTGNTGTFAA